MLGWRQIFRISYGQYLSSLAGTLKRWMPALVVFTLLVYLQAREVRGAEGFGWVALVAACTFFVALVDIQRRSLPIGLLSPLLPVTRFDLWRGQVGAGFLATLTSMFVSGSAWLLLMAIYRFTSLDVVTKVTIAPEPLVESTLFVRGWSVGVIAFFAFVVWHLIPISSPISPHRVQFVRNTRRARRSLRGQSRAAIQAANRITNGTIKSPRSGLAFSVLVFTITPIVAPVLAFKSAFLFFCAAIIALIAMLHHGLRASAIGSRALGIVGGVAGGSGLLAIGMIYSMASSELHNASAERKLAAADFLGVMSHVSEDEIVQASFSGGNLSAREVRAFATRYRMQQGRELSFKAPNFDQLFQQGSAASIVAWSEAVAPEAWNVEQIERFARYVGTEDINLAEHPIRNSPMVGTAVIANWLKSDSRVLQYLALQKLSVVSATSPALASGMQNAVYEYAARLIGRSLEDNAATVPPLLLAQTLATASAVSGIDLTYRMEREGRQSLIKGFETAFGRPNPIGAQRAPAEAGP